MVETLCLDFMVIYIGISWGYNGIFHGDIYIYTWGVLKWGIHLHGNFQWVNDRP